MTLTDQVVKNIIKRLIKWQNYRIEIVIDASEWDDNGVPINKDK